MCKSFFLLTVVQNLKKIIEVFQSYEYQRLKQSFQYSSHFTAYTVIHKKAVVQMYHCLFMNHSVCCEV